MSYFDQLLRQAAQNDKKKEAAGAVKPAASAQVGGGSNFDQLLRQAERNDAAAAQGAPASASAPATQSAAPAPSAVVPVSRAVELDNARIQYKKAKAAVDADKHSLGDIYSNDFAAREAERERREQNEKRLAEAAETMKRLGYAEEVDPTLGERVVKTLTGSAKLYGAQGVGVAESAANVEQAYRAANPSSYARDVERTWMPPTPESTAAQAEQLQQRGSRLKQSGSEDVERAQQGLGTLGRLGVQAAVAATQMGADVALGALTGGGSMLPMVVRSFGGGVQEAREKGYDAKQQVALGLANAATEWFTEKLFGGNPAYDTDVGLVNKLVAKVSKNERLVSALSSLPADIISEGLEEIIADVLEPISEKVITGNWTGYDIDRIIEDGVVGMLLGGVGQGGNVVVNAVHAANAQQSAPQTSSVDAGQTTTISEGNLTPAQTEAAEARKTGNAAVTPTEAAQPAPASAPTVEDVTRATAENPVVADVLRAAGITPSGGISTAAQTITQDDVKTAGGEAARDDSLGSARSGFDPFTAAELKYGTMEGGVNAVRPDDAPVSTNGEERVSRSVVSMKGAAVTPEDFVPLIERRTMEGGFSYIPISNDATTESAKGYITRRGWASALRDWTADVRTGKNSAETSAVGALLYNNAVNSGDYQTALDILGDMQDYATNTAQSLQALRILKTLTPDGQLYLIRQQVDKFNEQQAEQTRRREGNRRNRRGATDNIPVSEWMKRVGEDLADHLVTVGHVKKSRAKTVCETILSDLKRFYAEDTKPAAQGGDGSTRTEFERIYDMFQNRENYQRAWDAARAKLAAEFGEDSDAMAAFEEWFERAPDYTARLTRMLTGEETVSISQELCDRFLSAQTAEERDAVVTEMQKEVAAQLPSTFLDKWNALRYVNMLGNFRTQGRNLAGNAIMQAATRAKDAAAVAMEGIARAASGGRYERTKALLPGKALTDAAAADFANVEQVALGEVKYDLNEGSGAKDFMRGAKREKRIFRNGALEGYRKATDWAMEKGDVIFSRASYARALAGYLKAHHVTAAQFTDEDWRADSAAFIDKARAYAIREAQEATFRDTNAVSKWASQALRGKNTPAAARVLGEGLLPFRKTPANVAVRAEEYSPLGVINTAYKAAQLYRGAENVTGADVINQAAKTLTGTGIFALGFALRALGRLRGGKDEDDNQAYFDDLTGHQLYSLELPEQSLSYTMDWATPASIPLFMGVELYDLMQRDGFQLADVEGALTQIAEPMLEMSMLSGVNSVIDELKYGDNNIVQLLGTAVVSYATQALTNSLLGQLERSAEPERVTTFVDKDGQLPAWLQRQIGKASAKTPLWDYHQTPYITATGEREDNGNLAARIAQNLFSPGYVSRIDDGELARELQRVADGTKDTAIFPRNAEKTITEDGKTRSLTQAEYEQYATAQGRAYVEMVSALINGRRYGALSDEEKADAIRAVRTYSAARAKQEITGSTEALTGTARTVEKAAEAARAGRGALDVSEYFRLKVAHDKINEGDGSANEKATRFADYLRRTPWLSEAQRETAARMLTFGGGYVGEASERALSAVEDGTVKSMDEYYRLADSYVKSRNGAGASKARLTAWIDETFPKDQRRAMFDLFQGGGEANRWKNPY